MKYLILIMGVILAYLIFVGMAKSQDVYIPPSTMEECSENVGKLMEVAGLYITKEATAKQQIEDLKAIIRDLQAPSHRKD